MKTSMKYAVRLIAAMTISLIVNALPAHAGETMTDRCSSEVAIVPAFGDQPDTIGTIILKRGPNGTTDWTPPFTVRLSGAGRIRWWCHSTTGNAFDPGTWRVKDLRVGVGCQIFADGQPESCGPAPDIKLGSSVWNGWTAERSRCGNRSNKIRARLGTGRLLQIECLGH